MINRPAPRVLVPCAVEQAPKLSALLRARGAIPVELPFSRTLPPSDPELLQFRASQWPEYDLVIFSSVTAVNRFMALVPASDVACCPYVAAVGSETARALIDLGTPVSCVPPTFTGEGLADALLRDRTLSPGGRALVVRAQEGRDVVGGCLTGSGWQVDTVAAYRTEYQASSIRPRLHHWLETRRLSAIFLTASGVARTLAGLVPDSSRDWLQGMALVSIGPVTTSSATVAGLSVHATAKVSTFVGMIEAWAQHSE